ncbi:MAG: hypothetical protein GWO24_33010, partial [Akkermansiaceae bacterium]|nr:hypothetical protein [Akkermansiaceae bacterium]
HHNIIWNINGTSGLTLWGLPPTSSAYGNSGIRAYNNTVEGEIKFQGSAGSIAGHDIRNNITERLVLAGHGREDATITHNLVSNQGFNSFEWPGNIFAPPNFVAGALANFYLLTDSAAYEAGQVISPFTDGFSGTAPEIGALEHVGPDA